MNLKKTETLVSRNISKKTGTLVSRNISAWLMLLPAFICLYLVVIRPQVLGLYWSFFDMKGYNITEFVGLENYKRILSDGIFLQALVNTVKYVVFSIIIGFFIPIIMAVMLNEMVTFRNGFRFWIYFPSALPGVAVMMLWYLMYYPDAGGLLNMALERIGVEPYIWLQDSRFTILYIVISMTWSGAGATTLFYFAALQGVSRELVEAALIDGAGFFRRLWTVSFPRISGIVLLFFVRQIIAVFSIMEQPLQMTDGGPNNASTTLGLLAYKYGFVTVKPNLAMVVGGIMFVILVVFTIFYFFLNKKVEENNGD